MRSKARIAAKLTAKPSRLNTGRMNQPTVIQNNAHSAHQIIQAARQTDEGRGDHCLARQAPGGR
jgi:hypothetical protein